MAESHYHARLVWSGGALGPTKSVEAILGNSEPSLMANPRSAGLPIPPFVATPRSTTPKTFY